MLHGKLGACLLSLISLNALILSSAMIFLVSSSLLWNVGNHIIIYLSKNITYDSRWRNIADNYGIMMGQYCLFLSLVNELITSYLCSAFGKLCGISLMTNNARHRFDLAPALPAMWLCTKYQFYFPVELLIFATALLIIPICAVCNLRMTGSGVDLGFPYLWCNVIMFTIMQAALTGILDCNGQSPLQYCVHQWCSSECCVG